MVPPSIIMLCMLSLPNDGIMLKHPADRQSCRGPLVSRIRQPCSPCGLAHSQSPCTSMQSFHACQRHPGAVSLGETSLWRYTRACTRQACGLRLHSSPTNLIRSSPAQQHAESRWRCRARTEDAESTDSQSTHQSDSSREIEPKQRRRKTDTPDFISSALTRRFGWVFTLTACYAGTCCGTLRGAVSGCSIAGGLAWAGVLAFGVISEQIKTRIEGSSEARNTVVSPAVGCKGISARPSVLCMQATKPPSQQKR